MFSEASHLKSIWGRLVEEAPAILENANRGIREAVSRASSIKRGGRGLVDLQLGQAAWRKAARLHVLDRAMKLPQYEASIRSFYNQRGMWLGAATGFMAAYHSEEHPSLTRIISYTVAGGAVGRRLGAYWGEARIRSAFPDAARIKQFQARYGELTRRLSRIQSNPTLRNILNM